MYAKANTRAKLICFHVARDYGDGQRALADLSIPKSKYEGKSMPKCPCANCYGFEGEGLEYHWSVFSTPGKSSVRKRSHSTREEFLRPSYKIAG
jgi:hypothetical protein